jgi:hypothetical protein
MMGNFRPRPSGSGGNVNSPWPRVHGRVKNEVLALPVTRSAPRGRSTTLNLEKRDLCGLLLSLNRVDEKGAAVDGV